MNQTELKSLVVAADIADQAVRKQKGRAAVLPEVKNFQLLEGTLTPDGKWGPNSYFAASFYLMRDAARPLYSPNAPVTWDPPQAVTDITKVEQVKETEPTHVAVKKRKPVPKSKPMAAPPLISQADVDRLKQKVAIAKRKIVKKKTIHDQIMEAAKDDMPAHGQDLPFDVHDVEAQIAKSITQQFDSGFKDIKKMLAKSAIQKQATNEHKKIVAKDDFQKKVLTGIGTIIKGLPKDHPQKATLSRRFLGLVLP